MIDFYMLSYIPVPEQLVFNKKIMPQKLSENEKLKHIYYTERHKDQVKQKK